MKHTKTSPMSLKGDVTVSDEQDGTFTVHIGDTVFLRLPTREAAERRADAVRRFDAQYPSGF